MEGIRFAFAATVIVILATEPALAGWSVALDAWQMAAPEDSSEPDRVVRSQQRFIFDFDHEGDLGDHRWVLQPKFEIQSRDEGNGKLFLDPRETRWQLDVGDWSWRVGFHLPVWEGTDGLNPMDIASARDLRDPLKSSPISSGGLGIAWVPGDWRIEALWIPKQTPARLPGVDSAWYPRSHRLLLTDDGTELRLPADVEYRYSGNEILDQALDNNLALRVQGVVGAHDWALGFFEGAAQTPLIRVSTVDVTPIELSPRQIFLLHSPVSLSRIDYRRRTGSARWVGAWESWIVRAAIRHDEALGSDGRRPGWSQFGVFGIEKSFFPAEGMLTVLVQTSWGRRQPGEALFSFEDLLHRALMAGVRWAPGEKDEFYLTALREAVQGGTLASLEYRRRWTGSLSSVLGVESLAGQSDSYFALLGDRDRARVTLMANF